MEKLKPSYLVGGKKVWQFLKTELPYDLAIPLLSIHEYKVVYTCLR